MFNSTTVTNLATGQSHLRLQHSQLNLTNCHLQQQQQQQQPHHHHQATTSQYASNDPLPFVRSLNERNGLHLQPRQDTSTSGTNPTQLQQVTPPHPIASMSQFSLPNMSQVQHSSIAAHLDHNHGANESSGSSEGLGPTTSGRFIIDQQQLYPQLSGEAGELSPAAFFQQYYHSNTTNGQLHATNLNSSNHLSYYTTSNTSHHHYQQETPISFTNAMANAATSIGSHNTNTDTGSVPIRLSSNNESQIVEANQAANIMGVTLNSFRYRQSYLDNRLGHTTDSTDTMHNSSNLTLDQTNINGNLAAFNKLVASNSSNDNNYHSSDGINLSTDICTDNSDNNNHHLTVNDGSSNGVNGKNNNGGGNNKRSSRKSSEKSASSESLKRSYACPTCSKGFSEKFNMRRHMQIHSQSRPKYSCNECSKSFAWKDNFIRHRKAAHINI